MQRDPAQCPERIAPAAPRGWLRRSVAWKLAIVSLFLFLTGGPSVIAQYEDSNPGVYWRMERARQQKLRQQRVRKTIIQRPTRLIRRAKPRRGYTRAVPAARVPDPTLANPAPAAGTPATADPARAGLPPGGALPAAPAAGNAAVAPGIAPDQQPGTAQTAGPPAPMMSIAVIGDNLASQLALGLQEAYKHTPQVEILRLAKDNSGLVRKDYYDWTGVIDKLLAGDKKIDVAVMMIGSNDRQSIQADGASHPPRSSDWDKAYAARIEAIAVRFKQKNIPLLWIGMPVMRIERLSADMVAFNQMYRDIVQRTGGAFIDIWEAFLDDRSRFTLYGPDVNGEIVKLRVNDGVHFTKAGARKLAHFAEIDIKRIIDRRRAPAPGAAIAAVSPGQRTGPAAVPLSPDAGLRAALPAPAAPARIVIPVKPAAGPVVELTALPVTSNGELVSRSAIRAAGPAAQAAVQAMRSGTLSEAPPGRADDFSWPRR